MTQPPHRHLRGDGDEVNVSFLKARQFRLKKLLNFRFESDSGQQPS